MIALEFLNLCNLSDPYDTSQLWKTKQTWTACCQYCCDLRARIHSAQIQFGMKLSKLMSHVLSLKCIYTPITWCVVCDDKLTRLDASEVNCKAHLLLVNWLLNKFELEVWWQKTNIYLNGELGLIPRDGAPDGTGDSRQMVLQPTGLCLSWLVGNALAIGPLDPWARSSRQQYSHTYLRFWRPE